MTYIQPHMTEALKDHVLIKEADDHYIMRKPGTGIYLVHLIFKANRIMITGDLKIGARHGVISSASYGLEWFAQELSPEYLCEKFLTPCWQWEAANGKNP